MKKYKRVYYVLLSLTLSIAFGMTMFPAMAAMVKKQITVFTGVKIYIDDTKLNPVDVNGKPVEAFIYNGTTYLPLRAVSTAVGKPVSWNGKTQSVYLGKHDSTEPITMLKNSDYFNSNGEMQSSNGIFKDNMGNTYNEYMYANGNSWREYNINGQFSKIKGRLAMNYKYRSESEVKSYLKIYGDGKLLYTSPVMEVGVKPVDFDVDLTGVIKLKVEVYFGNDFAYSTNDEFMGIVNTGLYQ